MDAPAVEVEGLVKRFGATTALDGLDLQVRAGEVVGFLGPNGAGKTTTLRVLLGQVRAGAGRVRVLGLDAWAQRAAVHRGTGYVPGDLRLPPRLTGQQVLRQLAALRPGLDPAAVAEVVRRLAVPLDRPVRALSKGNRQKLGLVPALATRPRLLLLDEPTSGIDPATQERVLELVREAAAGGTAVLLSSHVLAEVEQVATRVAVLRRGALVADTDLASLREAARRDVVVRVASGPLPALDRLPGAAQVVARGDEVRLALPASSLPALLQALAGVPVRDLLVTEPPLEELFLSLYGAA